MWDFTLKLIFFFFVKKIFTVSLQCPFMANQILNPPIPKHKVIGSWNGLDLLVPPPCTVCRHKDGIALFRRHGPWPVLRKLLRTPAGPWTFPDLQTKHLEGEVYFATALRTSSGLRMSKAQTCGAALTQSWNPPLPQPCRSKQEFISISFVSWEARKPLSWSPWKFSNKSVFFCNVILWRQAKFS